MNCNIIWFFVCLTACLVFGQQIINANCPVCNVAEVDSDYNKYMSNWYLTAAIPLKYNAFKRCTRFNYTQLVDQQYLVEQYDLNER